MAKSPKPSNRGGKDPTADLYKLKTRAVDDLVTADESNSPKVSRAEMARYGGRSKSRIPSWLKVAFIKWWFPGAVFFFIGNGIPHLRENGENLIVILGIVLGMVTDLLTDNMIRFIAPTDGEYDQFLMFAKKRYITFVLNILYALVLCFAVLVGCYTAATWLFPGLPPEPITFGLFYMACDMLLLGVKYLIQKMIRGSKNKNVQEG